MGTKNAAAPTANRGGQIKGAGQRDTTSDHTTKAPARSTYLDHARAYGARGWWVFPLKPGTKQPITKHGFKDASNDPKAIRAWWGKTPRANIGLDCGRSGVIVIDVDGDEGFETLGDLEASHSLVYHTLTSHTPGKAGKGAGAHLLFKMPAGLTIGNKKIGPGLETRGAGGYIVLPPSIHPDHPKGPAYRWADDTTPIADLPQVFIDLLTAETESAPRSTATASSINSVAPVPSVSQREIAHYSQAAFDDELVKLRAAREGDRNNQLNRSAFALGQLVGAGALDRSSVEAALEQAARDIGLKGKEVALTIKSGIDDGITKPRDLSHLVDRRNGQHGSTADDLIGLSDMPDQSERTPAARMFTDKGNGERMADHHAGRLRYTQARGWVYYDSTRWQDDDIGAAMRLAKQTAMSIFDEAKQEQAKIQHAIDAIKAAAEVDDPKAYDKAVSDKEKAEARTQQALAWALKTQSRPRLEAMIALAQSERGIVTRHTVFDLDPFLFNTQNGTLDLRTGTLRAHTPNDLITKLAGTHYDPAATCPKWIAFLDRIMDHDQEMICFLQRVIGLALTGDTRLHYLYFLYGTGANGKSTLIETVIALLGDYARKIQTATLLQKTFGDNGTGYDLATLPGTRMAIGAELPSGRRLDEERIKDMVGGDTITARLLYKAPFNFKPSFKLWIYGNHRPSIYGTDDGIWRRVLEIPFSVTIPEQERDPLLPQRLLTELPGILAWAVRGCLDWQAHGLNVPDKVKAATAKYRADMDIVSAFFDECCLINKDDPLKVFVSSSDLYAAFTAWAERNGEVDKDGKPILSQKAIASRLKERGFKDDRSFAVGRIWRGIGLITPADGAK